jgi:hypothetical protein
MKNPIVIGFFVACINEMVRSLRFLFASYEHHRRNIIWHSIIGVPSFIGFTFFAGVVIEWVTANSDNFSLEILVTVGCLFAVRSCEEMIDTNGFVLNVPWRSRSEKRHAITASAIFTLSLIVSLVPFWFLLDPSIVAHVVDSIGIDTLVLAVTMLICVVLLYFVFRYLHAIECEYTADILRSVLVSVCDCEIVSMEYVSFAQIIYADKGMLETGLRMTEKHIAIAMHFKAIQNGKPVPGLADSRLTNDHINELAEEVQNEFLNSLARRRAMIKILVSSDDECRENQDTLQKLVSGPEVFPQIGQLLERRAKLRKLPSVRSGAP